MHWNAVWWSSKNAQLTYLKFFWIATSTKYCMHAVAPSADIYYLLCFLMFSSNSPTPYISTKVQKHCFPSGFEPIMYSIFLGSLGGSEDIP